MISASFGAISMLRRRLRSYLWRQWQNGPNRFKELRRRGVPKFHAAVAAGSPTGFWRMSGHPAVQQALRNRISTVSVFGASMFLLKLNPIEPPWYGPVCPVVWEGRRREASPYPDHLPLRSRSLRATASKKCRRRRRITCVRSARIRYLGTRQMGCSECRSTMVRKTET